MSNRELETFPGGAVNDVLFLTEVDDDKSLCTMLLGTFVAVVQYEQSFDKNNWFPVAGFEVNSTGAGTNSMPASSDNTSRVRIFPAIGRWMRARLSAFTSGQVLCKGFVRDFAMPPVSPSFVAGGNNLPSVTRFDNAASGVTSSIIMSAATTNAALLKNAACNIFDIVVTNQNTMATRYLKLYNKATAPTVTADVPALVIACPPATTRPVNFNSPVRFSAGLGIAMTQMPLNNDGTALATAGEVNAVINWA